MEYPYPKNSKKLQKSQTLVGRAGWGGVKRAAKSPFVWVQLLSPLTCKLDVVERLMEYLGPLIDIFLLPILYILPCLKQLFNTLNFDL